MKMRLPYPSCLVLVTVGSAFTSGLTIGMYLAGAAGSGSTSVLQTPRISEYARQSFTIPTFFFVSPPNAAARHHRCNVAHDVLSRSRVETKPASVHPIHSEFLLWSCSLVWIEQDMFTERYDQLIEWFASDALVCRHTVTANVERRQSPCCVTYKPFQD